MIRKTSEQKIYGLKCRHADGKNYPLHPVGNSPTGSLPCYPIIKSPTVTWGPLLATEVLSKLLRLPQGCWVPPFVWIPSRSLRLFSGHWDSLQGAKDTYWLLESNPVCKGPFQIVDTPFKLLRLHTGCWGPLRSLSPCTGQHPPHKLLRPSLGC